MTPTLHSERLTLRGWTTADFDAYAVFQMDPDLTRFTSGACKSKTQAWTVFAALCGEWLLRGYGTFAIEEQGSGALAGYAGLWHPADLAEPELCWGLFHGFHGKGYATEAALCARDWAATELRLPPLMSFVHPDNHASQNVAERLGAICGGETELRGLPRLFYRHQLPDAAAVPLHA